MEAFYREDLLMYSWEAGDDLQFLQIKSYNYSAVNTVSKKMFEVLAICGYLSREVLCLLWALKIFVFKNFFGTFELRHYLK